MDYYGRDLAYIHETGFTQLAGRAAADVLAALPTPSRSQRIIDLGCGGGTLAEQIFQAGYDIVGYDISLDMVEIARERVPNARFEQCSYADLHPPECSAVMAIGEVFNYCFDKRCGSDMLRGVCQRIYEALVPGGFLLFDIATPERAKAKPAQSFALDEEWAVLVDTSYDGQILSRGITSFRRIGEVYRRAHEFHRLRLIEPRELSETLSNIGFQVEIRDNYAGVRVPSGLSVFWARKPIDGGLTKLWGS